MAIGIGDDLDDAAVNYIAEIASRRYSVGNMSPEDLDAYVDGEEEGMYQIQYELFQPREQKVARVKAAYEDGQWKVQQV
jgi:hypothetical protein